MMKRLIALVVFFLMASTTAVMADMEAGKAEYMVACAICHANPDWATARSPMS